MYRNQSIRVGDADTVTRLLCIVLGAGRDTVSMSIRISAGRGTFVGFRATIDFVEYRNQSIVDDRSIGVGGAGRGL